MPPVSPVVKLILSTLFYALIAAVLSVIAPLGRANDFTPRYVATRAALSGESLYSQSTTELNQIAYYGYVTTTEDQQAFAYPAYSTFIFAPLTVFPLETAAVLWRGFQLVLCCLSLYLLTRRWYLPPLLLFLLHEPLVGFLLAQTVLWSTAWLGFALYALERGWHARAGICCALAAVQPTLTVPLALVLLIRERRALVVYILAMLALVLASILVFGWWLPDWLSSVSAYSGYVKFLVWLPQRAWWIVPIGVALLILALLEKRASQRLGLGTAGSVLLLPLTGLYHLTLFAPSVCRFRWQFLALIGLAAWGLILLPFEIRAWEAGLLVAAVMFGIKWEWIASRISAPRNLAQPEN